MTPHAFIAKWRDATLKERSAAQEHFLDLCRLLDEPTPAEADQTGATYCFERGAVRTDTGGNGWADVWKRHCFAWEYKGQRANLDAAFMQLQQYALALENPPLLIVSDLRRFRIRTNWTNSVSRTYEFDLDALTDRAVRDRLKWAFSDPERLRPGETRRALTERAAAAFAAVAQTLRARGHDPPVVAHFVNRLVFCMFADDVGLLPDLARSPFHGEGHRKVHARLRILDGIRVARTRVLRVMRAHGLLSPHRGRQGAAKTHDGRVITQAPNVMWGTDGVRVFTLDDGWGWIFAAVEHWNAECVGWHVCKVGSRFAALDPIAQGLERLYGSLDADVARGLALRMDHGSQYLSDHFLKQIRYWGIHPSFGFVEEPETNGVAERWNRTLKEQAIHGRIFQNLEAVRAAVADFVERYNQTWRLEKLGYHTPIEAREEYELRQAA